MKIKSVDAYELKYTVRNGGFILSGGRKFTHFNSLLVRVVANNGLEGWGEHVSAPQYMVALQGGALAALDLLVPSIID